MKIDEEYVEYLEKSGQLMTSDEVSEYLQLHPCTLSAWRQKDYGPKAVYIGVNRDHVRYRMEDIQAYLNDPAADGIRKASRARINKKLGKKEFRKKK